jgi:aconitate hydratase
MTFADETDYDRIKEGDMLVLESAREQIKAGSELIIENMTTNCKIRVNVSLSDRQAEIILAGGLLNYTRKQGG